VENDLIGLGADPANLSLAALLTTAREARSRSRSSTSSATVRSPPPVGPSRNDYLRGLGPDEITTLASLLGLGATALNNQTAVFARRGEYGQKVRYGSEADLTVSLREIRLVPEADYSLGSTGPGF
jgi:hypothetical protein